MCKRKNKNPLRFADVFLIAWIAMLVLIAALFYLSARQAERGYEEMLNAQVQKAREEQVNILTNIYYTSRNILGDIMYDSDIRKILKNTKQTDPKAMRTIQNKLRMAQNIHINDINCRVALLDMNGNMYTNWRRAPGFYDEIMENDTVRKAIEDEQTFFLLDHPFWYEDDENPVTRVTTISFCSVVLDQFRPDPLGIFLFSVEEDSLLSALDKYGQVAITSTETGNWICGSVDSALYASVCKNDDDFPLDEIIHMNWQGRQTILCRSVIAASNIELLQVIYADEVYDSLISLRHLNLVLALAVLSIAAVLMVALTVGISRPLYELHRQVHALNVREDGSIPRVRPRGYRECVEVADAINDMSMRMTEMIEVIKRQQSSAAKLEYQYLLSQLAPHFLLNSLNNIKWMAYMNHAPRVAEMIRALGFLLETSLGKNPDEVTVDYEISHLQNYMLLQTMHYGDNVVYSLDTQEDAGTLPFESFTLQTLAGNAIKHGYVKGKVLHIDIRIATEEEKLTICVKDDGKGMEHGRLEELRQELRESESGVRSAHIGLHNLCQRLAYRYGRRAELQIDSEPGCGTTVVIRVPIACLKVRNGSDDV